MLLRLAPDPSQPTILFSLAFPGLPEDLPFPSSWNQQLNLIRKLGLDGPTNAHALDKSVWTTSIFEQVEFDLVANKVTCICINDLRFEWPISPPCRRMLHSVLEDVAASATEAERERAEETMLATSGGPPVPPSSVANTAPSTPSTRRHSLPLLGASSASPATPTTAPTSPEDGTTSGPRRPAHQRSKSLISSLLSALMPAAAIPTIPRTQLPTKKLTASRHLRRKARSTLVDAFRAHVIPEINRRFQWTNYALWATKTSLHRTESMLAFELESAKRRDASLAIDISTGYAYGGESSYDAERSKAVEIVAMQQGVDRLKTQAQRLMLKEHIHQRDERDAHLLLELRAKRRAWSINSYKGSGTNWLSLGAPIQSSRLSISWAPEEEEEEEKPHSSVYQHIQLPSVEMDQWMERVSTEEESLPRFHASEASGSSYASRLSEGESTDDLLEESLEDDYNSGMLSSDSEDENMVAMSIAGEQGEDRLPLPPGLHGQRSSYYLPRLPPMPLASPASAKPHLSLSTAERHPALLLDTPSLNLPEDVGSQSIDADLVVGIVGVTAGSGLGIIETSKIAVTSMIPIALETDTEPSPPASSLPSPASSEESPLLTPTDEDSASSSSDSTLVSPEDDQPGVTVNVIEVPIMMKSPSRPPKNPARLSKGAALPVTLPTPVSSDVVAEGVFAY